MSDDGIANMLPPDRLLIWADFVESVVGNPTLARRGGRTPPLAAYRRNAKGRAAWLAQTERQLRREGYDAHMRLDRDLPAGRGQQLPDPRRMRAIDPDSRAA
jgi:hypothetical protein